MRHICKTLSLGNVQLLLLSLLEADRFLVGMQCMGKTDGNQTDLGNDQITAMWTPKMEPESSKWLPRMSKKGPRSQQWRRRGDRRHSRKQKGAQWMPMEGPKKAQKTKSEPTWAQKGCKKCQKKVQMRGPEKAENRALACTRAQFSA